MLVLLLKSVIFVVLTLWSLLTRLIFNTIGSIFVLLLQGLKGSSEGTVGIFQTFAEGIRACFEFILQLVISLISSIVSKVFDIVIESVIGSVTASGSVAAELAEQLKTSLDESINQVLPQVFEELLNMTSEMVKESWNNYIGAVGYVQENS
ncbi:hypothetical protein VNO80_06999 [Phaseolus coccineus]|uniref:Uncharacterized protein n=1 Tax=Phaseolus coccineus TaxID=3886 RepID=A0AAN9NNA2_PHACN